MATRGRPPKPLDRDSSSAAFLGAELRARREERGLTQKDLAALVGFSPQHVSEVERAKAWPTHGFIAACDDALEARGQLLKLLPAALNERETGRQERAAARRASDRSSVPCAEELGEGDDVEPTTRRGLIGAGAATALGGLGAAAAVPAAGREVDPELPTHLTRLLNVLGRHDEMFGPGDVLATVHHQVGMIAQHREIARGDLHTELLRAEARFAEFAAWLSDDTGDTTARDNWTKRALRLARTAQYPDMIAYVRSRQSQWAAEEHNARRAIALAEDALRVPGTSAQMQAWCSLRAAIGHALANDVDACQRSLADAYRLVEDADSPAPPWAGEFRYTSTAVRAGEARCWLSTQPKRAIGLYEDALREWPRDETRGGGVHQARLALACAATNERDRAEAEGRKALAIARTTNSNVALRELKQLGRVLGAN
jgi:transcriptional regulator with XRE-family HTH domain